MAKKNHNIDELVSIIRHLRAPDGCPWDRKQTHESLKTLFIEEAAELLDAIDAEDSENIKEELGDLLMHIVFHSQIANENGRFSFEDVVNEVSEKMLRRHPHIFGNNQKLNNPDQVVKLWEEIKSEEKKKKNIPQPTSILDGIPNNLPALVRAEQIQEKAAGIGFDWENEQGILIKLDEEIDELKKAYATNNNEEIEEEIGDLLFTLVNLSRFRNRGSSTTLLNKTIDKFKSRFNYIETQVRKDNKYLSDLEIAELEYHWQNSKSKTT
ncbi:MAG TPA: nucleoside triphosphate pyrophosphohydrolase [Victivallales bacterium]|nr:nucleoside triphosphate pyrophosphohydrolase [Victivallales bacterium]